MDTVLVGMFDTRAAAEQARTQLLSAGFASNAVSMTGEDGAAASGSVSTSPAVEAHRHQGPIARFFENLFGSDDDTTAGGEAGTYREAFRRGAFGITVLAQSDSELDRAQAILNDAGAIDIDTRAETWRQEGWTGGQDAGVGSTTGAGPGIGNASTSAVQDGSRQTLQEVEEELKVGKRTGLAWRRSHL